MIVLVAYPDDSCARVTLEQARQLASARGPCHGLRFYDATLVWDGRKETDPYLSTRVEPNRRQAERPTTLGVSQQRVRTIQSIADLPEDQQRRIAADGKTLGPEVAGRRWNLSKQSVTRVMKMQGQHERPPTAREARIFSRAHA